MDSTSTLTNTGGRDGNMHPPLHPDIPVAEQVRGEPMTTASDVYSLASVTVVLLTGTFAVPR